MGRTICIHQRTEAHLAYKKEFNALKRLLKKLPTMNAREIDEYTKRKIANETEKARLHQLMVERHRAARKKEVEANASLLERMRAIRRQQMNAPPSPAVVPKPAVEAPPAPKKPARDGLSLEDYNKLHQAAGDETEVEEDEE
jgi:hypothetical protein